MKIFYYLFNAIIIFIISVFIAFVFNKASIKITFDSKQAETKPITKIEEEKKLIASQSPPPVVEDKNPSISEILQKKIDPTANITKADVTKSAAAPENGCPNESEVLLLDLTLNLMTLPEPVRIEKLRNGNFVLPKNVFDDFNIITKAPKVKTSDCLDGYMLEKSLGFAFEYDSEKFTLDIKAPYDAFALNIYDKKSATKSIPEPSHLGTYLNYSVFGTQVSSSSTSGEKKNINSASGLFEHIIFNKYGSLSNSLIAKEVTSANSSFVRGDSYFQRDFPSSLNTLVVGDTNSSDGNWSRAVHYLGVRWAKDFSLQPGYIYTPNNSISGSAALPSVVDVYINNQKTYSEKITPGPFNFSHLPIPDGAGNVSLIVKDLLGNEQIINQSFFQSSYFLAKDESNYSFESGLFRKNFGTNSSDYSSPFLSSSYNYGVTNTLTTQGRFELQPSRQAIGGSLSTNLGNFGLLQGSTAVSNDQDYGVGGLYGATIQHQNSYFNSNLSYKKSAVDFRPFASSTSETKPKEQINVGLYFPIILNERKFLPEIKSALGVNYIEQTRWNAEPFRGLSVNSGFPLPFGGSLGFFANKTLTGTNNWSSGVTVGYSFGGYNLRTSNSKDPSGINTQTTSISSNAPNGPGIGWGITNDNFEDNLKLNAIVNTNAAQATVDISQLKGDITGKRLGLNGSLGLLQGQVFATRTIGTQSFAITRVGDFEGIPIYSQNTVAATSNSSGIAVIPIRPYEKAKIEIKEEDLPLDLETKQTEFFPTSYARAGVFVDIPIRYSKNLLIHVKQTDGRNVPAGAIARLSSSEEQFVIAKDGELYLMGLSEKNRVVITWLENKCEFDIAVDFKKQDQEITEHFVCAK